ncbi:MAG TPA: hypothetical protein VFN75_05585 [Pseudonocardiaceae bacterium]|nr:hypothetical protein [Pseudonocardiaceae bacterium]
MRRIVALLVAPVAAVVPALLGSGAASVSLADDGVISSRNEPPARRRAGVPPGSITSRATT